MVGWPRNRRHRPGAAVVCDSPVRRVEVTLPGMAVRGRGGPVATAVGVAAGAGAAQLGLGYGLGIVVWSPVDGATGAATWLAALAWATWITAGSTVLGALGAARLGAPEAGGPSEAARRWTLAGAAAAGGLVPLILLAVPARGATGVDGSPQAVVAGFAAAGLGLGVLAAVWALSTRPVAVNLVVTIGWVWFLGVVAVTVTVATGGDAAGALPGFWSVDPASGWPVVAGHAYRFAGGVAVLAALAAGLVAGRAGGPRTGTVVSGTAGPLLVAAGHLITAPALADMRPVQVAAQLVAPYAALAGLAGSAVVAALAERSAGRAGEDDRRDPDLLTAAEPAEGSDPVTGTDAEASDDPDPIDDPDRLDDVTPYRRHDRPDDGWTADDDLPDHRGRDGHLLGGTPGGDDRTRDPWAPAGDADPLDAVRRGTRP
jgi:hypothetical protein